MTSLQETTETGRRLVGARRRDRHGPTQCVPDLRGDAEKYVGLGSGQEPALKRRQRGGAVLTENETRGAGGPEREAASGGAARTPFRL